jgi:hypothetical protein
MELKAESSERELGEKAMHPGRPARDNMKAKPLDLQGLDQFGCSTASLTTASADVPTGGPSEPATSGTHI